MRNVASKSLIWATVLLRTVAGKSAQAEGQQENLIGCWGAAYEYDSVYNRDGSATGNARLCSREPTAKACGDQSYLDVTYCFDREGNAYGSETHCVFTKKGPLCHGSDGLSGSYRLQGNRMDFFEPVEEGEEASRELAWSCSFSISENPDVLGFSDCDRSMKIFFRDCDFSQGIQEYKTSRCELTSR
jgi:hypothetical protein